MKEPRRGARFKSHRNGILRGSDGVMKFRKYGSENWLVLGLLGGSLLASCSGGGSNSAGGSGESSGSGGSSGSGSGGSAGSASGDSESSSGSILDVFESEPDAPTALVATLKTDGGALRTVQVGWGQSDGAEEYRIILSSTVGSGTLETTLAEGITGISRPVQVPAHKMRVSRIFVEACNTGGTDCVRSEAGATLAAESVNSLIGYFKSSAAGSGEKFGTDVALSADGKTLAVGVPEENGEGSSGTTLVDSGAVVVFRESEGI